MVAARVNDQDDLDDSTVLFGSHLPSLLILSAAAAAPPTPSVYS